MFEALREILAPDFLLKNSIYVTLLIGLMCPVIGCYLILRRLVFLGVALPQVASAGVAVTLALHVWVGSESAFHFLTESPFTGSLVACCQIRMLAGLPTQRRVVVAFDVRKREADLVPVDAALAEQRNAIVTASTTTTN